VIGLIDRIRRELEVLGPIDTVRAEARRLRLRIETLPPIRMLRPGSPVRPRIKTRVRRIERKLRR